MRPVLIDRMESEATGGVTSPCKREVVGSSPTGRRKPTVAQLEERYVTLPTFILGLFSRMYPRRTMELLRSGPLPRGCWFKSNYAPTGFILGCSFCEASGWATS